MYPIKNKTYIQTSFLATAAVVGLAAVLFAKVVTYIQLAYFEQFRDHPVFMSVLSPFFFVAAASLVVKGAPEAKGSGIPQVLEAIHLAKTDSDSALKSRLVSLHTAGFKVFSTILGLLGGASIGREGPTVQIASSLFAWMSKQTRKYFPTVEGQSYLVAGGAAGVAAAFNTPLAGVTFALEEIAESSFSQFKGAVMLSVILAGITAQALMGDYLYFGQPTLLRTGFYVIPEAVIIGALCGVCGGLFAKMISQFKALSLFNWWQKALICGILCSVAGFVTQGATAGSGYEIVRDFMNGGEPPPLAFGAVKFVTTVFSYISGMAGGIFSPCLSIGAGLGYLFSKITFFAGLRTAALIGMVSFFSGAVGAPLTAVVIVMEMTNEHALIIPFMIGAFLAQRVARIIMPVPLYHYLAFGPQHHVESSK